MTMTTGCDSFERSTQTAVILGVCMWQSKPHAGKMHDIGTVNDEGRDILTHERKDAFEELVRFWSAKMA